MSFREAGEFEGTQLVGRLARAAVHDLNNVAAVVGGHLFLMRDGGESLQEASDEIDTALEKLQRLCGSLSALAGVGMDEPEQCDVNEIARLAAGAGSAELELASDLPALRGRRRDLLQAIEALVRNAREASPDGGRVRISTGSREGRIHVRIEDFGTGVPPDVADRVFDPLFSTRAKGRGMGLTIAAMVAAMHGGSCTLETREGGGTRAVLELRGS